MTGVLIHFSVKVLAVFMLLGRCLEMINNDNKLSLTFLLIYAGCKLKDTLPDLNGVFTSLAYGSMFMCIREFEGPCFLSGICPWQHVSQCVHVSTSCFLNEF